MLGFRYAVRLSIVLRLILLGIGNFMRLTGLIRLIYGLFLALVVAQSGNAQLADDGDRKSVV